MAWSVEQELLDLAGLDRGSAGDALSALGIVGPSDATTAKALLAKPWRRTDFESYCAEVEVWVRDELVRRLILKACVALGRLGGTSEVLTSWMRRRMLLSHRGVTVSDVYGAHSSTILEEYVPYSLEDALQSADSTDRRVILVQLGWLAGVLTEERFGAVELEGLRSHGHDVVVVNFGTILGPPGISIVDHSVDLDIATSLADRCVALEAEDRMALSQGYEAARQS